MEIFNWSSGKVTLPLDNRLETLYYVGVVICTIFHNIPN